MKNVHAGSLLAAALIGAVSAVLTTLLITKPDPGKRMVAPLSVSSRAEPVPAPELGAQLQRLREENRALLDRIVALEARPVDAARSPVQMGDPAGVEPSFEQEVRSWMASMEPAREITPDFMFDVRHAIGIVREEEQLEEERLEAERRAERTEERLARLASELDLEQHQIGGLRTLWSEDDAAQDALRVKRDEFLDRQAYRDARQLLRDEHNAGLARILTPTQLTLYQERRARDREQDDSRGRGRDSGRGSDRQRRAEPRD